MKDQALWDRIDAHPMPDGFIDLLGERTGWPADRATRAVLEYKRLAYLTALVRSARRVPSKPVERVWDLHREAGASYARFTADIMGRDWTPPRGGFTRRDGRDAVATRKAYIREFGEQPPARHWPDPNRAVRLTVAVGFGVAGAAGSLAAASVGPVVAGAALALLILLLRDRGGGDGGDDSAHWGMIAAGDGGFDGGDGGGGCD
jgi:hypothetical protein